MRSGDTFRVERRDIWCKASVQPYGDKQHYATDETEPLVVWKLIAWDIKIFWVDSCLRGKKILPVFFSLLTSETAGTAGSYVLIKERKSQSELSEFHFRLTGKKKTWTVVQVSILLQCSISTSCKQFFFYFFKGKDIFPILFVNYVMEKQMSLQSFH